MPTRDIANQGNVNANNASKTSRYRPEIDGLRAFAVVAVIINHFNKDILPGGYLGVDIFFVISGYVITSSLFGRPSKDFKDFISGFYERRIKRLVPALIFYTITISIATCLINPRPAQNLLAGITGLVGFSNIFFYIRSTDYFAGAATLNPFTQTWSLGVEEQFYILFPFLIWFSGFGRQTKNGARNLFLVVGALTIASIIGFLYLYPTNQPAAYFLMPSRFWEMAAGCLIFIGFQKRASIEQLLEKVPPLLVLLLVVGVMYLPMSLAATSTIAVVALSSILIASLKHGTAACKFLTNTRVVYIGKISYSLYLWHWGILSLGKQTIGLNGSTIPILLLLVIAISEASYRFIETPLRQSKWSNSRNKTFLFGLGSNFAALSFVGMLAIPNVYRLLYSRIFNTHIEIPILGQLNRQNCINNSSFEQAHKNCWIKKNENPTHNPKRMFFMGDSQNESITYAAKNISEKFDYDIFIHSKPGTAFPPLLGRGKANLIAQHTEAYEFIKTTIKKGEIVVVTNRIPHYFLVSKNASQDRNSQKRVHLLEWSAEIRQLAALLQTKGAYLIVSNASPEWKEFDPIDCALATNDCKQDLQDVKRISGEFDSMLNSLNLGFDNIYVLDMTDALCEQEICLFSDSDGILYRDAYHLSNYAANTRIFLSIESIVEMIRSHT